MYVLFDTETTGLNPTKNGILTAYFAVIKKDQVIDELELFIKCDSTKFVVEQAALDVNKIVIKEHNKTADEPEVAGKKLKEFLENASKDLPLLKSGKKEKLNPAGQFFHFDVPFIEQILPEWSTFVNRKGFDTSANGMTMYNFGFITNPSPSLGQLLDIFDIQHDKNGLHNAKTDAQQCFKVFLEMRKLRKRFENLFKEAGITASDFITGKTRF